MLSHTAVWDKWEIEKISFLISLAYRSASTHFEPLVDEPVEEDQVTAPLPRISCLILL